MREMLSSLRARAGDVTPQQVFESHEGHDAYFRLILDQRGFH